MQRIARSRRSLAADRAVTRCGLRELSSRNWVPIRERDDSSTTREHGGIARRQRNDAGRVSGYYHRPTQPTRRGGSIQTAGFRVADASAGDGGNSVVVFAGIGFRFATRDQLMFIEQRAE